MGWDSLVPEELKKGPQSETVAKGNYTAIVDESVEWGQSKDTFVVKYKITEGEHDGRVLWVFHKWTPESIPFICKDLMNAKVEDTPKDPTNPTQHEAMMAFRSIVGWPLSVYVKPREYNGKTYYNVYVNERLEDSTAQPPKFEESESIPF